VGGGRADRDVVKIPSAIQIDRNSGDKAIPLLYSHRRAIPRPKPALQSNFLPQ
jgi:hypothetical protein